MKYNKEKQQYLFAINIDQPIKYINNKQMHIL